MSKINQKKILSVAKKNLNKVVLRGTPKKAEGMDYIAYVYRDDIVIRVPKNSDARKRVTSDFSLLTSLENKLSVRIPKPIQKEGTMWIAAYKAVSGNPVSVGRFKKFNAQRRVGFAKQIAVFIEELQGMSSVVAKSVQTETPTSYKKSLDAYYKVCLQHKWESSVKDALQLVLNKRKEIKTSFAPKLIHGDLGDEHIYSGNKRREPLGFIDFSDARIDDPAREFSSLYCYGEKFVANVCSYYSGKKDRDFLKRAKLYRMEEAVKILSYAVRRDSSMTLKEAKELLLERVTE